jgi:hypothetical protein
LYLPSPPDDDDATVITSNCASSKSDDATASTASLSDSSCNSSTTTEECVNITLGTDNGVADTGATGHFMLPNVKLRDEKVSENPLNITMPDGETIHSTHEGYLPFDDLPEEATLAHKVPGLAHSSLISIKVLCDHGCYAVFTKKDCKIYYKGKLVLVGYRHKATGLWIVPLGTKKTTNSVPTPSFPSHAAHNAYQSSSKAKLIQFLHQCAFSPPPSTWIRAINNQQFASWPGLTADAVRKYLPDSTATAKGHMKKTPANVRSTRPKPPTITVNVPSNLTVPRNARIKLVPSPEEDLNPPTEQNDVNHIFCWAALADRIDGTTYTDLTGRFPTMSMENKQYIFVAYDYTTNAILVRAITDRESATIVNAFDDVFTYLEEKGFKPRFNVLDNEASSAITEYLRRKDIKWQFVPPNEHRVNAAERAIQTFKNHFIAGLCSTDKQFPSQLWDKLLPQAQDSLNMLRTSRIDPSKSAYEVLEGPHDFNRHPWAPPGCRAVIHEPADSRSSWGPRGIDAWYIAPATNHYRSYNFYVPETRAYRISASAQFFPAFCDIPTESPVEAAARTAAELIIELRKHRNDNSAPALSRHQRAIKIINDIYKHIGQQPPRVEEPDGTSPRVEPTLSNNPTAPRVLKSTPRTHNRVTRNNTPGLAEPPVAPKQVKPATRRSPRLNPTAPPTPTPQPTPSEKPAMSPPVANPLLDEDDDDSVIIPIANIPATKPISVSSPQLIPNDALQAFVFNACSQPCNDNFLPKWRRFTPMPHLEHFASPVVHPVTGETIDKYEKLMNDPATRDIWTTAFGKEIGGLAQGDNKTGAAGTNTIFFMNHDEIKNIPKDRTVTYARVVVDYRPQKEDPNRVRITVGGNLIDYPGELTTRTADLVTSKILWNSVVSTPHAKYVTADLKLFYLTAPMDRYEYMRMPLRIIPDHIIEQYNLRSKAKNGFVYMEIRRAMYGLPQAGMLANKLLKQRLAKHGYYEVAHTPGLWKHISRPISFTLVVDDFGIKYVGKEHADHLLNALKEHYTLDIDWEGKLYCGISLDWDYDKRTVDISMPNYIKKLLQRFQHELKKAQHSPFNCSPKRYGKDAQLPLPLDESPRLDKAGVTRIQQIVGAILYYARCVDITLLMTLSTIAHEQTKATENTNLSINQLLDYCATHPNAKIRFRASDMILNIHSDASYLNEPEARSRVGGHFFLGWLPQNNLPIKLNGAIHVVSTILKFVAASAAEAELGALFVNAKEGRVIRLILEELGHPQPPTPIHCDNSTAAGIANNTVKRQRSRSMEMRYFWIADQVARQQFDVRWHPGQENLGDYYSKHHPTSHHIRVRPYYLLEPNSPLELPRAMTPAELRGCAKIPMAPPISRQPLAFPIHQHSRLADAPRPGLQLPPTAAAATAVTTCRDTYAGPIHICPLPAALSCS